MSSDNTEAAARRLTRPRSRRNAFGLLGGAVAALGLGSIGLAGRASAQSLPVLSPTAELFEVYYVSTISARATIQASSYNAQNDTGTEATSDVGGGLDVGWIQNGSWLQYDYIDFSSAPCTQFIARVASGAATGISGLVQVCLDSLSNPAIGSFAIASTGGWQNWQTVPVNIAPTTGVHNVFLSFVSGQSEDFVNVNWFTFS